MNDEYALLNAIAADPEDDTVRLAYADWLDENPKEETVRAECPHCDGHGEIITSHRSDCYFCKGEGWLDTTTNANPARAEFIRVQCELERTPRFETPEHYRCDVCGNTPDENGELEHGKGCYVLDEDGGGSEWVGSRREWIDLTNRSDALLATHRAAWQKVSCLACKGEGGAHWYEGGRGPYLKCVPCGNTGDALHGREVVFRRGFVEEVKGCRLWDVFRASAAAFGYADPVEWRPTPFALAVVRTHPTILRVPLVDRETYGSDMSAAWAGVGWQASGVHERMHPGADGTDGHRYAIPELVFDALKGTTHPHATPANKNYPSRAAAHDDLATATADVLRAHIKKERK